MSENMGFIDKNARIAVMLGGRSGEREVSLRSGSNALAALRRQGVDAYPVDPGEEGWLETLLSNRPSAVFLALHGRWGEDGSVQGFLETLGLRYTGSGVLASALAMHKGRAKQIWEANGLPTPPYIEIDPRRCLEEQADQFIERVGLPAVVKPASEGSSLGVVMAGRRDELTAALYETRQKYGSVLVEKRIKGMEATVGLLGDGPELRALPILELVPRNDFYDYHAKYTEGMTEFILPARLSPETTLRVQQIGMAAHRSLGCRSVSRVDMMIDANEEPYILDLNTLPGLTDLSDLPAQAAEDGVSYDELIMEILRGAFAER